MIFTDINHALETLMNRYQIVSEYKLDKLQALIKTLGQPQDQLTTIHIAGTNGKGSTTDYLRSILQTQGYKVASFTSPHLISHHDRFRINNIPIADEDLLRHINLTTPFWDDYELSMFEIDVLIAIQYFLEQKVDIALFEVGLGGRLDATNILNHPITSIITNIGYDHMNILGNTLEEIASEKAGIIKESGLVITGEKRPELIDIFKHKANRDLIQPQPVDSYQVNSEGINYFYRHHHVHIPTLALYQIENSKLAFEVAYQLNQQNILKIDTTSILKGLSSTLWQGRFEKMLDNPPVFIDGAHNEAGINQLIKTLRLFEKPLTIVFSAVRDKNYDKMIASLETITNDIIVTEFEFNRATTTEQLALGHHVKQIKNYKEAIDYALKTTKGVLIVTGSLYFVSDARQYLKSKQTSHND